MKKNAGDPGQGKMGGRSNCQDENTAVNAAKGILLTEET